MITNTLYNLINIFFLSITCFYLYMILISEDSVLIFIGIRVIFASWKIQRKPSEKRKYEREIQKKKSKEEVKKNEFYSLYLDV